jgi:hypothetical protein
VTYENKKGLSIFCWSWDVGPTWQPFSLIWKLCIFLSYHFLPPLAVSHNLTFFCSRSSRISEVRRLAPLLPLNNPFPWFLLWYFWLDCRFGSSVFCISLFLFRILGEVARWVDFLFPTYFPLSSSRFVSFALWFIDFYACLMHNFWWNSWCLSLCVAGCLVSLRFSMLNVHPLWTSHVWLACCVLLQIRTPCKDLILGFAGKALFP